MERDEMKGANPADVAKVVEKILKNTNPPRRVSVGKFDERMGIMGKRLLPFRVFEKAAKSSLGVGSVVEHRSAMRPVPTTHMVRKWNYAPSAVPASK